MFLTKKKKIRRYLDTVPEAALGAFDLLLADYLGGELKARLAALGITGIGLHADWMEEMRCISAEGRWGTYYMDLQIYPDEFLLDFDEIEPDGGIPCPLESRDQLYAAVADAVRALKNAQNNPDRP